MGGMNDTDRSALATRRHEFVARQRARAEAAEALLRLDEEFPGLVDEYLALRSLPDTGAHHAASTVDLLAETDLPDMEFANKKADEAAAIVLRRTEHPMRTPEIVAHLREAGFGKEYADLRNAIHTALSRKADVFERDESGAWRLK